MSPREAIEDLLAAWEQGDPSRAGRLFTTDGVYIDPLFEHTPVGPGAIEAAVAGGMGAITECRINVRHLASEGAVGFIEAEFTSVLADGSGRLDFPFAMLVEMREGLIERLVEYFDTRPLVP
jgi:ketosteroid isomerase-like protein